MSNSPPKSPASVSGPDHSRQDEPSARSHPVEQKRIEAAAFLAAIVESSDDAIIGKALDGHGTILSWNKAAERLFGYSAEQAVGQPISIIIPPDLMQQEVEIMARLRQGERLEHFETVRTHKSGTRLDVSVTISPIRNREGHLVSASSIVRDITARKSAEEAQRQSEALKTGILNSALDAIITINHRREVIEFNPAAERMFGYTRAQALGGRIEDLIVPPSLREAHLRGFSRYLTTGESHILGRRVELTAKRANGSEFPCELEVFRVPMDGDPLFTAFVRDVTERKRKEEELRESEERFRTLADNIAQFAWMADAQGWIFWYNQRWFDYTGTTLAEMRGWGWQKVHHPGHLERVSEKWRQALETGEHWEDTFPLRSKTGEYRWFLTRAVPIRDAQGRVVRWFGTNTDITEQRNTETELRMAREQIARRAADLEEAVAERTRSLQDTILDLEAFSYSITHDMRGPLRAMAGYAHVLEEDYAGKLDEQARTLLNRISTAARRLDRLIQDVLTFSRLGRADMPLENVDLRELIEDIVHQYPDVKAHIAQIEIACHDVKVRANVAALTQCISNLLSNAVKFVAKGQTPQVRIFCEERGTSIRLWVEDKGIGIAKEQQERIFGVFQRLHDDPRLYPGTGIGLAIVQKAVERMNGRVGVESEPARGARFWIELPRAHTD
jgi:PAS domain S-box-containing protein